MKNIDSILKELYPATEKCIIGQLVYLEEPGLTKLALPALEQKTQLEFYKATFLTGYLKFTTIDVVAGFSAASGKVYLLANPLFSDKYSDLIEQIENIEMKGTDVALISEIIQLYACTGLKLPRRIATKENFKFGLAMTDGE